MSEDLHPLRALTGALPLGSIGLALGYYWMRTITLKLPDGLAARVSAAVKRRGSSTSALVREAIGDHFDSNEDGKAGSCFDLASDLCGSLTGPADLSSNPKYRKGYGR